MEIEKMINCKEDLVNTYIVKGDDALTKAYLNACKEYVDIYALQCDRWPEDRHLYFNPKCKHIQSGECDTSKYKEITIKDLKPRTKTEFVKCEYSREWKAVRHYNEVGELFVVDCNGNYTNVNDIGGTWYEVVCKNYKELYIKVETEIDERQEFIDAYASLRHEFHGQRTYDDFSGFMFDSGKFKLVDSND